MSSVEEETNIELMSIINNTFNIIFSEGSKSHCYESDARYVKVMHQCR